MLMWMTEVTRRGKTRIVYSGGSVKVSKEFGENGKKERRRPVELYSGIGTLREEKEMKERR